MTQESFPQENLPIADAIDRDILMHREVHFGGQFSFMIDYYQKGSIGIHPDFTIERILALQHLETTLSQNLATIYLDGADAERVAKQREVYKHLRDLYEKERGKKSPGILLADLILSEEEDPSNEIEAIVAEKEILLPLLLDLLRNKDYYDPLSPGYGSAPDRAVRCLQKIGDKRAVIALFEAIGTGDFFDDDQIFLALRTIGIPAKEFLLRVVGAQPITEDNERAAMALSTFEPDEEIALRCLSLLEEDVMRNDPSLAPYLLYATEFLAETSHRSRWIAFLNTASFPSILSTDLQRLCKKYA